MKAWNQLSRKSLKPAPKALTDYLTWGVALGWTALGIYGAYNTGWYEPIPVFQFGRFGFGMLPTSLFTFAAFLWLMLPRWRWKALPYTIMAGLAWDASSSIFWHFTVPINYEFWTVSIMACWYLVRPHIKFSAWFGLYWMVFSQYLFITFNEITWGKVPTTPEQVLWEMALEPLWLVAFYKSFRPASVPTSAGSERLGSTA